MARNKIIRDGVVPYHYQPFTMSSSLMDRRESLDITMLNSDRTTNSPTTDQIVKDPRKDGAYREQSMINNARVLVFVVLVIATFAVVTGCYIFTSEQERIEFDNEVLFSVLLVIHFMPRLTFT